MKKSKKVLTLMFSLFGVLSLASCSDNVKADGKNIIEFTFNGTDGENGIKYTADDLLLNKLTSRSGTEDYYNAVYEVMVRRIYNDWSDTKKDKVDSYAKDQVKSKKEDAKQNAENNGTKYEDEWKSILEANEVEDEKELELKFQLEKIKEMIGDEYYDTYKGWQKNTEDATQEELNLVWGSDGYINTALPYHVKHILVKDITSDTNDYATAHISEDKAEQLGNIIQKLARGEKFSEVAKYSDDTSNANGGDLGIMSITESYVPEFKLGIYTYDSIFNDKTKANASIDNKNKFGASEENLTDLKNLGIQEIPYEAAIKLTETSNVTTNNGVQVNEGNEDYFPRNILFNKYFNNRNLAVITPTNLSTDNPVKVNGEKAEATDNVLKDTYYTDLTIENNAINNELTSGHIKNGTLNQDYSNMSGFQKVNVLGEEKTILCDEKGNPILMVRVSSAGGNAYEGVHLIVVERSVLEETVNGVSLNEYYAAENPLSNDTTKNPNFPTTEDGKQKTTFVNSKVMKYSDYTSRVETLKTNIKSFDEHYDMRVYKWIVEEANVEILPLKVGDKEIDMEARINAYLSNTISDSTTAKEEEMTKTWNEFIEHLNEQQSNRKRKLIPDTCALNFDKADELDGDGQLFGKGGACYYEK